MKSKLRVWRVVPTKGGVQAPYSFVETTEFISEKAEAKAKKIAREGSGLGKFHEWSFEATKLNVRKDDIGRYFKYHQ